MYMGYIYLEGGLSFDLCCHIYFRKHFHVMVVLGVLVELVPT